MVKELRTQNGRAGMMDCKEALTASDGDFEKAIDYLAEEGDVGGDETFFKGREGWDSGLLYPYGRQDRRYGRGELRNRFRCQD